MADRILIIKLSALGDVIQTLPTLEALRQRFPGAEINWLVEEAAAPLLPRHPALDQVLVCRRQSWLQAFRGRGSPAEAIRELRQLLQTLRHPGFDLVLDLQGLLKSALWTWAACSPRKLGFAGTREFSYLPLTEKLPPYDPEEPAIRRYLRLAAHLGAPTTPVRFRLALPRWVDSPLAELLTALPRPWVVLHPGCRWPSKHWPPEQVAALADLVARDLGTPAIFTGSTADRPLLREISSRLTTTALDLSGRLTLPELAALFSQADAVVSPDTGPMHLAAAVGAPLVALFGPTAPWRTGPYGPHRVLRLALPCSPCFRRHCPDPQCLSRLAATEVYDALRQALTAGPPPKRCLTKVDFADRTYDIIEQCYD